MRPPTAGYGQRHGWGRGRGSRWFEGGLRELTRPNLQGINLLRGPYRVAAPVDADQGENSIISSIAARAPYIVVADVLNGEIRDLRVVRNEASLHPGGAGLALAQILSSIGVNAFLAPNAGPNLLQALAAEGITVIPVPPGIRFRDAVRRF